MNFIFSLCLFDDKVSAGGDAYGPDIITNGSFDSDLTGWSGNPSFTWEAGRMKFGAPFANHTQQNDAAAPEAGETYLVEFDYEVVSGSGFNARLGSEVITSVVSGSGSVSETVVTTDTAVFDFITLGASTFYVDNVVVRKVL